MQCWSIPPSLKYFRTSQPHHRLPRHPWANAPVFQALFTSYSTWCHGITTTLRLHPNMTCSAPRAMMVTTGCVDSPSSSCNATQPGGARGPVQCSSSQCSLQQTLSAVQIPIPPDFQLLGARVEHLTPHRDGQASAIVAEQLELPQSFVEELIHFGAVHYCPVHPAAPTELPASEQQRINAVRASALKALGRKVQTLISRSLLRETTRNIYIRTEFAGKKRMLQYTCKIPPLQHADDRPVRLAGDVLVHPGAYLRVHVHPKRFPAAYSVDWKERLLLVTDGFVVVDKPAGIGVSPRVDNILESTLYLVAQHLGLPHPLRITHRLDVWTEGVLVMATSQAHVQWFNSLLQGHATAFKPKGVGGRGNQNDGTSDAPSPCQQTTPYSAATLPQLSSGNQQLSSSTFSVLGSGDLRENMAIDHTVAAAMQPICVAPGTAHDPTAGSAAAATRRLCMDVAVPAVVRQEALDCSRQQLKIQRKARKAEKKGNKPGKLVIKYYRTLTSQPPPLGSWLHYAHINQRLQGVPAFTVMQRRGEWLVIAPTPTTATAVEGMWQASVPAQDNMQGPLPLQGNAADFLPAQGTMQGPQQNQGTILGQLPLQSGIQGPQPKEAAETLGTEYTPERETAVELKACQGGDGEVALGGLRAELEVLTVQQVQLNAAAALRWGPVAYESHVRLITGRTHQIRAQLAREGFPLLGDDLYQPLASCYAVLQTSTDADMHEGPQEHQSLLSLIAEEAEGVREAHSSSCTPVIQQPRFMDEPNGPYGLQAWKMEVLVEGPLGSPAPVVLEAGIPWWRTGTLIQENVPSSTTVM